MKALTLMVTFLASFGASAKTSNPVDFVATSDAVQTMVSAIAAQSFSGDPVYCDFDKMKVISTHPDLNDLNFQVRFQCGAGESQKSHMTNIKVYVKGFIEDSTAFVTGIQLDHRLR